MTDQPQTQIQLDAREILTVLQQTHPEAVQAAVWRVRAEQAEKEREQLLARVAELETHRPADAARSILQEASAEVGPEGTPAEVRRVLAQTAEPKA